MAATSRRHLGARRRGEQALSLAYAEYVDPLRSAMVRFAGNLSGSVYAQQVWLGDDWFTYRTRGSAVVKPRRRLRAEPAQLDRGGAGAHLASRSRRDPRGGAGIPAP